MMTEANRNRRPNDQLHIPSYPGGRTGSIAPCFAFCTETSRGCNFPNCNKGHFDLSDPARLKRETPTGYLRSLYQFLQKPEIAQHITPSQAFTDFQSQL